MKLKQRISLMEQFWIPVHNNRDSDDYFTFLFHSMVFISIAKKYQVLETKFYRLSKRLEFRHKYSAEFSIATFYSVFGHPDKHSLPCLICYAVDHRSSNDYLTALFKSLSSLIFLVYITIMSKNR